MERAGSTSAHGGVLLSTLATIAHDAARVMRSRSELSRTALAVAYVKAGLASVFRRNPVVISVHGLRVHYVQAADLFRLFRDTFVDRCYAFDLDGPQPTIIDAGSNIGVALLWFKLRYPHAKVIAFEPNPAAFSVLQKNVAANALEGIDLHETALGGAPGTIDIFTDLNNSTAVNTGMFARKDGHRTTVRCDLLSSYIHQPVDLLKLDIEGLEEAVLSDLASTGKLNLIRNIVCEYHHHLPKGTDRLSKTLGMLEEHGFVYHLKAHLSQPPIGFGAHEDILIYATRRVCQQAASDAARENTQGIQNNAGSDANRGQAGSKRAGLPPARNHLATASSKEPGFWRDWRLSLGKDPLQLRKG